VIANALLATVWILFLGTGCGGSLRDRTGKEKRRLKVPGDALLEGEKWLCQLQPVVAPQFRHL
jgi:hypothetical protein